MAVSESDVAGVGSLMDQLQSQTPLPRWRCHKEVHAAKIIDIRYDSETKERESNGGAVLVLQADPGVAFAQVSREFAVLSLREKP